MAMRNAFSTLALAALFTPALAQIPNGGFEEWATDAFGQHPLHWLSYDDDMITPGGTPHTTVEPGMPGAVGNYHVVVATKQIPGGTAVVQGWLSAGDDPQDAGFGYSGRPAALTGQWQYGIMPGDTGVVTVALRGPDLAGGAFNMVAHATHEFTGTQNGWAAFSIPLAYLNTDTPYRAYLQFEASKSFTAPTVGSFIKLDDLAFQGTAGINPAGAAPDFALYPVPAGDQLHIDAARQPSKVALLGMDGRVLVQHLPATAHIVLDLSSLAAGTYMLQMQWPGGLRASRLVARP